MTDFFKKIFTKEFLQATFIRALYTFAEVLLGFLAVGASVSEVNWGHALSVSIVATIISILKSILVGLPEVDRNGPSAD